MGIKNGWTRGPILGVYPTLIQGITQFLNCLSTGLPILYFEDINYPLLYSQLNLKNGTADSALV